MAQSKAESFTAYLEAKQRWDRAKKAAPTVGGGTALSILAVLAGNAGQPMPLTDLQAASDMSFSSFAEAIKRLQDSGYLTLVGTPGAESAQLTKLGAEVASLA
ncbi:MAG: hypothetical protein ABSH32_23635 [Bryobacteraceae bacterium]|jgi:predicted transcriptional regulator